MTGGPAVGVLAAVAAAVAAVAAVAGVAGGIGIGNGLQRCSMQPRNAERASVGSVFGLTRQQQLATWL